MRDKLGRFVKGYRSSPTMEFKKGHKFWLGKKRFNMMGEKHPNWKGGRFLDKVGYVLILKPEHPFANSNGYIWEHRLIIEQILGRYLKPKEITHHLGKKNDNRPNMLMLFKNGMYHFWFHKKGYCNLIGIIFDGKLLKFDTNKFAN